MPRTAALSVTVNYGPNALTKNDTVHLDTQSFVVAAIDRKQKWAVVTDDQGRNHRLPMDTRVDVTREVQTDEEKIAQKREFCAIMIQKEMDASPGRLEEAKAKMIENLQYAATHQWRPFENHIDAQECEAMWFHVRKINDRWFSGTDVVSALATLLADLEGENDDRYGSGRRLSRSTAVGQNYVDDIVADARESWYRQHRTWTRGTGAIVIDRVTGEPQK